MAENIGRSIVDGFLDQCESIVDFVSAIVGIVQQSTVEVRYSFLHEGCPPNFVTKLLSRIDTLLSTVIRCDRAESPLTKCFVSFQKDGSVRIVYCVPDGQVVREITRFMPIMRSTSGTLTILYRSSPVPLRSNRGLWYSTSIVPRRIRWPDLVAA